MSPTGSREKPKSNWNALFSMTILGSYFYALTEWLFLISRPSPLSILALSDSIRVLLVAAGAFALISIALLGIFSLPAFFQRSRSASLDFAALIPALVLAVGAVIALDDFTNATFHFGMVSTKGILRGIYGLSFLLLFWGMLSLAKRAVWAGRKPLCYLALGLLAISTFYIVVTRLTKHPDIIILGSDGLSASYLTAYNPDRQTTPVLAELARTSLVAENAFPNAGSTTGSTTSVLTGKKTLETKVYRFSDVLTGKDSLEHLPGVLRQHGYETVEIGAANYVDARKLNVREGFDIVNGQVLPSPTSGRFEASLADSLSTPFIQTVLERAMERLLYILFIGEVQGPPPPTASADVPISDEQRIDQIIDLLGHSEKPLFIFVHLMDTHGPKFTFQEQVFSSDSSLGQDWDQDRYQDALRSFDRHVQRIYDYLAKSGKLDNTILVIYTDHGFRYATRERIPIVIHFPKNASAGRLQNNVQNIDIPVTLLDYLGVPAPPWMSGGSLLDGEAPADRMIISTTSGSPKEFAPPFYQINTVQMIVCHRWYVLNVRKSTFESGTIAGHTSPCEDDALPSDAQARARIGDYLQRHGYDTHTLDR